MVFQVEGSEPLDAIINVRLTTREKMRLQDDADTAGMSMSALVRAQYFRKKIIADADAVMIRELKRVAGSLRNIHNESNGAYSKDTAAALDVLARYIEKLSSK